MRIRIGPHVIDDVARLEIDEIDHGESIKGSLKDGTKIYIATTTSGGFHIEVGDRILQADYKDRPLTIEDSV